MSSLDRRLSLYLTGLRNQHAVETRAIGTIQNELSRMEPYPELHSRMREEKARSVTQAARLDELLANRDTKKSVVKEAVSGAVATIAGFAHAASEDEVIKNVLAAVGFKAYEVASYTMLVELAGSAGAASDQPVLEQSLREEQETREWLNDNLIEIFRSYLMREVA